MTKLVGKKSPPWCNARPDSARGSCHVTWLLPWPALLFCRQLRHLVGPSLLGERKMGSYRDSSCRVVDEHLAHEVHPARLECDKHLLQRLRLPLGELVPVPQLAHSRPHLLVGGPQQLEDVQQLLDLAVSREEGRLLVVQ